jgi:hypothetical protein
MTVTNSVRVHLHAGLAAALAVSMNCPAGAQTQDRPVEVGPSVRDEVTRIEHDSDPRARYKATAQIVSELRNGRRGIDESDISALTELLGDSNELVRGRAAVALGLIGPRASRAVPALRSALDEVECVRADQNSRFVIAVALQRIGVAPNRPICIATPHYGLRRLMASSEPHAYARNSFEVALHGDVPPDVEFDGKLDSIGDHLFSLHSRGSFGRDLNCIALILSDSQRNRARSLVGQDVRIRASMISTADMQTIFPSSEGEINGRAWFGTECHSDHVAFVREFSVPRSR